MKLTITQPTRHDGRRYAPGDRIDVSKEAGTALIACGAAEIPGRASAQDSAFDPDQPIKADDGADAKG